MVNNWLGIIGSIVAQFNGKEATSENKNALDLMLHEAGVAFSQLRPWDPRIGPNPHAPVNSAGLTIAQLFTRAYTVNWAE